MICCQNLPCTKALIYYTSNFKESQGIPYNTAA